MRAEYQVFLYNNTRQELRAPLDQFTYLEYVRRVNTAGHFSLRFPADELPAGTDLEALAADARVVVWRKPQGMGNAIDFAGLGRFARVMQRGQRLGVEVRGYHYNELPQRRIVAYNAGSSQAEKSGAADTVIYEMWDENLGASAAAARRITGEGFSLGAAAGTGTTVDVAFARANLHDAMLKVHEQSRDTLGTAAWFGFVPLEEGLSARFDVRVGQWGLDHRWPDGDRPVLFGVDYGNAKAPEYDVDRRGEATVMYCGGQGREENRIEGTPQDDAERMAASPLNRREGFFDGRLYTTVGALENAARQRLREADIVRRLSFDVTETDTCRYGYHWQMGDLVTGAFTTIRRDYVIAGVLVTVIGGRDQARAMLEEYAE